jgi:uncharacterized OB-fold protein
MDGSMLFSIPERSARQVHLDGLRAGELLYQYDEAAGAAVFYPREVGPSGSPQALGWRRSAGRGTVYSWTVLHSREGRRNIVLVDLDEGFRMMSTVVADGASALRIGQRVQARIEPHGDAHRVVFEVLP